MPSIKEMLDTPVGPRGERAAAFLFKASQIFFVAALGFAIAAWTFKPTEAAAATYYPDANPETSSVDGPVINDPVDGTWSALRDASVGTTAGESTANGVVVQLVSGAGSDTWTSMARGFIGFDTSAAGTVSDASICVYVNGLLDSGSWNLNYAFYEGTPASTTALVVGDFDQAGTTALSESRAHSSMTDETVECWDLNATGLTYLNGTNSPVFVLRSTADATNTPPSWAASKNSFLQIYWADDAGTSRDPYLLTSEDPRESPVVTINEPDDEEAYAGFPPTYQVVSNVCANDYPGETDIVWDFDIEKWDGDSWEDYASASFIRDGFLVANGCSSGLAYAAGGVPDPPFPVSFTGGSYRVAARVTFDGYSPGSYSAFNEFTVSNVPYGGGGGGSWSAGDGGGDEWNTVLDNAPTAPTCDFWGSSAGAGLECLWTWTRYIVIPPDDYFFDIISKPIDTLATRWPFVYLTDTIVAVTSGWSATETCPLPTVGGGTALGSTVPSADLCDWFDTGDVVEANPAAEAIIVTIIWLGFSLAVFYRARSFLMS